MKIQVALFAGLALTLGTAMSAVAVHNDRDVKAADVAVTVAKSIDSEKSTSFQVTSNASRILVLPRPL